MTSVGMASRNLAGLVPADFERSFCQAVVACPRFPLYAHAETWFGTSENDPNSRPQPVLSRTTSTTLQFPSVSGNDYRVEYSDDLVKWTPVIVTATGSSTTWTDLNAVNKTRRFYRVVMP